MAKKIARKAAGRVEFTSESEVREAVAQVRDAHATLDAAEQSDDWKKLRPLVARWARTGWARPKPGDDGWPDRIARIYLRKPHLLPPLRLVD